jgi:O-antigen/teichoic acid export membrane protein
MSAVSETKPRLIDGRAATSLMILGLRGGTLVAKVALTVFVARFIGLEALGTYGLIVGLTVAVPVVASLGLIAVVCRNAVTQSLAEVTGILRYYAFIQAGIYAVGLICALVSALVWDRWAFAATVIAIVALEQINDDLFTLLNHLRQPRLANLLMLIRSAGWISVFVVLSFLFPSMRDIPHLLGFWIAGGLVTLAAFACATRDWPWTQPAAIIGRREWLTNSLLAGRHLYVNNIANALGQYLDRFLVGLFLGLELTGVYVLFWSIGNALSNLIGTSVTQVAVPTLIKAHRQQSKAYWDLFRRLMVETALGSIALVIVSGLMVQFALPYLNRPVALDWLPALWLILFGIVLRIAYEVQGVVFYTQSLDRLTLVSGLIVLVIGVGANLTLVPVYSLYGTAAAILVSYSVGLITRGIIVAKYCR